MNRITINLLAWLLFRSPLGQAQDERVLGVLGVSMNLVALQEVQGEQFVAVE